MDAVDDGDENQISSFDIDVFPGRDMPLDMFSSSMELTSYVMICVAIFGFAGNILTIITYSKIGFLESINISYFALGVSDLLCTTFLSWNAICYVPAFTKSPVVPFIPKELGVPTGGYPSALFLKTTAWITAFISLERCLCVVFPFKNKTIVRRSRTITAIAIIYGLTVIPIGGAIFFMYAFELRFDGARNRTLLRSSYINTPLANAFSGFDFIYKLVLMNFAPFFIILLCAIILAIKLNQSATWRREKSSQTAVSSVGSQVKDEKAERKYSKDLRVAKTVLAIAIAFLFPGTINTVKYILAITWPAFHPARDFGYAYRFMSRMEFLLSLVNSSVNFIIYYKMGTKFRATVKKAVMCNRDR